MQILALDRIACAIVKSRAPRATAKRLQRVGLLIQQVQSLRVHQLSFRPQSITTLDLETGAVHPYGSTLSYA